MGHRLSRFLGLSTSASWTIALGVKVIGAVAFVHGVYVCWYRLQRIWNLSGRSPLQLRQSMYCRER